MIDSFITHCFIEFYYRGEKGFLNEHSSKMTVRQLCESYGVFDGCRTLAQQVADRIKEEANNNPQNPKTVVMSLNNNWIAQIELMLTYDYNTNGAAAYFPAKSRLVMVGRQNVKKFYPLRIDVNVPKIYGDERSLVIYLMHELTHAYEDYCRMSNGTTNLGDEAMNKGYFLNNVGNYDGYKNYLSYVLYFITGFERNAYVSQMSGELQLCKQEFQSISEVIDYLRNTKTYTTYMTMLSYIDFFVNVTEPELQNIIFNWIKEMSALNFRTYAQFAKYLKQKKYEIQNKFNTVIPKMAYEYLDFGNKLHTPNVEINNA